MAQDIPPAPASPQKPPPLSAHPADPVPDRIRIKNRRKRYLDQTPSYFNPSLELAEPLLYDRLVRRFQTAAEREAEGRARGFSGVLEADLYRSEAKLAALAHPADDQPHTTFAYRRGCEGEIVAEEEEEGEAPGSKQEGWERWKFEMEMRFIRGGDEDFDYATVDGDEKWDDRDEEDRTKLEDYLGQEEPTWVLDDGKPPEGETGVQDY
jgi:hypothetical protein